MSMTELNRPERQSIMLQVMADNPGEMELKLYPQRYSYEALVREIKQQHPIYCLAEQSNELIDQLERLFTKDPGLRDAIETIMRTDILREALMKSLDMVCDDDVCTSSAEVLPIKPTPTAN